MSRTAMTQSEAVVEVANIIGRDRTSYSADQTTTYEDRIKQWLYWSHLTMARVYAFPELDQDPIDFTLTTNTYAYTFAGLGLSNQRLRQILNLTCINGTASRRVGKKLYRDFMKDHPYIESDSANQPYEYMIYGRRVELWPKPDSGYVLRIRANYLPTDYASSSDASVYLNKDDVIIAGAVTHAYLSLQEMDDAEKWGKIFAGRLSAAISHDSEAGDWEPEGRASELGGAFTLGNFEANPLVFFNP